MTRPDVKIATKTEEDAVIDALKLAFAADPATRCVWPNPQKYLLHFSKFAKAFGGMAFVRVPNMLEIIQVRLFGFHQKLILMLIHYLGYCKKPPQKKFRELFQKYLRKWAATIQVNLIGICRFLVSVHFTMAKDWDLHF